MIRKVKIVMSDPKFKAYLWKQHKEYYREENGNIFFHDGTPQEILDSYQLWKSQIQKLNEFPTTRKSGLFSIFEKPEKKLVTGSNSNIEKARAFINVQCSKGAFNQMDVTQDFIFIGCDKNLITSIEKIKRYQGIPSFHDSFKKQNKVIVLWSVENADFVTVFWFHENNQIYRVQEYVCSQQES